MAFNYQEIVKGATMMKEIDGSDVICINFQTTVRLNWKKKYAFYVEGSNKEWGFYSASTTENDKIGICLRRLSSIDEEKAPEDLYMLLNEYVGKAIDIQSLE